GAQQVSRLIAGRARSARRSAQTRVATRAAWRTWAPRGTAASTRSRSSPSNSSRHRARFGAGSARTACATSPAAIQVGAPTEVGEAEPPGRPADPPFEGMWWLYVPLRFDD